MALRRSDRATAEVLIEAGADVNARDDVRAACCFGNHPPLDQRHGACPQIDNTPLHEAARYCQKEQVQLLLSHGARASFENMVSKQVAGHSRLNLLTCGLYIYRMTKLLLTAHTIAKY